MIFPELSGNVNTAADELRTSGSEPQFQALTRQITIEAWLRPHNPSVNQPGRPYITIVGYGDDASPTFCAWEISMDKSHSPATFFTSMAILDPSGNPNIYNNYANSFSGINDGQLYHVVGTYDGTYIQLYVNGQQQQQPRPTNFSPGTIVEYNNGGKGFAIGGEYDDDRAPTFDGTMGQVAVYDYALSASQVAAHYQTGIASVQPQSLRSMPR